MADDGDVLKAEQGGSAVFGVVHHFGEASERGLGQQAAELGQEAGIEQFALEHAAQGQAQPFAELQGHVADETVADGHVHFACEEIAPFDIAAEIEVLSHFEQLVRLFHLAVALAFLFADAEKAHAGGFLIEDVPGEGVAHQAELKDVIGLAIDGGTHVQQDDGFLFRGEERREGGAFHAGDAAHDEHAARDGGSGVTRADNALGRAVAHKAAGDLDGGVLLPAQDVRRLFVHARDFGGMDDFQIHPRGGESVQFAVKCSLVPDKENFGSGLAGGLNRSGDDHGRTEIASHGVDGDNGLIAAHRRSSARRPDDRGRCRSWGRQRGEPWGLRRCSTQRWGWPRDRGTGAYPSWNETSYFAVRP